MEEQKGGKIQSEIWDTVIQIQPDVIISLKIPQRGDIAICKHITMSHHYVCWVFSCVTWFCLMFYSFSSNPLNIIQLRITLLHLAIVSTKPKLSSAASDVLSALWPSPRHYYRVYMNLRDVVHCWTVSNAHVKVKKRPFSSPHQTKTTEPIEVKINS
jgi:hypothetical protein